MNTKVIQTTDKLSPLTPCYIINGDNYIDYWTGEILKSDDLYNFNFSYVVLNHYPKIICGDSINGEYYQFQNNPNEVMAYMKHKLINNVKVNLII